VRDLVFRVLGVNLPAIQTTSNVSALLAREPCSHPSGF